MESTQTESFDFGVAVSHFQSDEELLRLPIKRVVDEAEPTPPTRGTALAAQKEEATAVEVAYPFSFDGELYHMPPADEWDLEVFELIEAGKLVTAMKMMIGDKQWRKFKSKPRKAAEFNDFFLAGQEALPTKSN